MKSINKSCIDEYLVNLESKTEFSGVVGIYNNNNTIFEKTYGFCCYDLGVRNSMDTKFQIGSLTKQFTAACILKLVDMKKLSINDCISMYIKGFPEGDLITINQLLGQSSGIFDYTEVNDFYVEGKKEKSISQVVSEIKKYPLSFKPGSKWEYSNSNYVLLSYIVEKISNQSFSEFLSDNLFSNNNISNTGLNSNKKIVKNKAFGYTKQSGIISHAEYLDMTQPSGAGGLYSTIGDLKIWCNALMTNQIIPKKMVNEMFDSHIEIADGVGYGYGQVIRNHKSKTTTIHEAGHYGGMPGFSSYMSMYRDSKTALIILSNLENENLVEIVSFLKDKIFVSL